MIPTAAAPLQYFAHHGRTFHFAARLLPARERARVAALYAYCRFTDDIVDEARGASSAESHHQLDQWLSSSRAAYGGEHTGIAAIDRAMHDMREHGLPFRYAEELIAGTRMDIDAPLFSDMEHLRGYTYRVAGVVGLWMSESFGVHEPWVLERAVALGHAMQLTNIVRDVGEDWSRGRVYLPTAVMESCGLCLADIRAMYRHERPVTAAFRTVLDALMTVADAHYCLAYEAMPFLPPALRRSVAVAAEVYRGIHAEVRRADYDTFSRRAYTSVGQKVVLGARGLQRLRAASRSMARDRAVGVPRSAEVMHGSVVRG